MRVFRWGRVLCAAAMVCVLCATAVQAQESGAAVDAVALPDAPSAKLDGMQGARTEGMQTPVPYERPVIAPKLDKYIQPDWTAQPLTAKDKLELGLRDLYQPGSFVAIFASASFSQAENGTPNYGTDAGAFGQRLGATAIRDSTGSLFTDGVFAPLLHEDPRYYIQGSQHNIFERTLYAVSRPLVTRTDHGKNTINGALLAGNAAASVLTAAYYPKANRNVHDVAAIYGTSIGGTALGFFVDEFIDGLVRSVHLGKR